MSEQALVTAANLRDDASLRASLQFRAGQSVHMNPAIIGAILVVVYTLHDRVPLTGLLVWSAITSSMALWRTFQAISIRKHIARTSAARTRRQEIAELTSSVLGSYAIGSAFWFVALDGDLYVKFVVTLFCMVYMMAGFVHTTVNVSLPYLRASGVVGQGILFWAGLGTGGVPHWDVLTAYCGIVLMGIGFSREHSRQLRESMAIRNENAALLKRAETDKTTIEQALQEARFANESKSRFLAAASHDLRQPLHALTMFLGTLTFHVTTDDARRLLGRIKETVRVLEEQFNSLLDLSRFDIRAVTAEIKPFRLDGLIERLVDEMRPFAEAKKLTLTATICPAIAESDAILLGRVLRNLLDNALKYTAAGTIDVRVTEQDKSLLVEIADTGPGIPDDQQTRIFDEYVQLTNPARQRRHGVGLGLAIVKRIDQLLGLKLTLQSTVGEGSRFSFVVPIAVNEPGAQPKPATIDPAEFKTVASVWILDDDPIALESMRDQLLAWGASVTPFSRPEDLLAALKSRAPLPNWIWTDDMLGASLSGLETAQILSRQFGIGNVCLITGNTEPARLSELRQSGFPVIVKPAKPEALIAVLEA